MALLLLKYPFPHGKLRGSCLMGDM